MDTIWVLSLYQRKKLNLYTSARVLGSVANTELNTHILKELRNRQSK